MKTLVIVGAGPGLGLSVAKKFGQHGFRVAAIARNPEKLKVIVKELEALGIEAHAHLADLRDLAAFRQALEAVKRELGFIEVLEFSPYAGWETFTHVLETTPQSVMEQKNGYLLPAVLTVNEVLPEMLAKGSGAFLFTTGISAMHPVPFVGNAGIVMSGMRNYAANLHQELKAKGVYVGHLSIGTLIQAGTAGDPDLIAELWYDMYEKQDRFEASFPQGMSLG